ncbi:MAG: hypothetical protein GC137_08535 [Alphaproteobacteria bacterium]|nr:hypothetical protein [Alphaproteobacteria bacterium]
MSLGLLRSISILYNRLGRRNADWYQDPVVIEKLTGFKNLSEDYVYPDGHDAASFIKTTDDEMYKNGWLCFIHEGQPYADGLRYKFERATAGSEVRQAAVNYFKGRLDKLIELNPQLETLRVSQDSVQELSNVIAGVASAFKPADIQFYLDNMRDPDFGNPDTPYEHDEIKERVDMLWPGAWTPLWRMSPETVEIFTRQLDAHEQKLANECSKPASPAA